MSYFKESKQKFSVKKEVMIMSFLVSLFLGLNVMSASVNQEKHCIAPYEIYEKNQDRVFMVGTIGNEGLGSGTGLFVESSKAITSTHVIHDAKEIFSEVGEQRISFNIKETGNENSTTKIYSDKKLNFKNEVKFSNNYKVGEPVYTIGYPGGLKKLFSAGHISAIEDNYIFVDMPMYQGMSGSPVFDCEGSVIGYVYAFLRGASTIGLVNKNED